MNNNSYQTQSYYQPTTSYFQQQPLSNMRPMQQMNYQSSPLLKGRLVSSFEEAKAAGIDFDGSIFYFPDLANRRIYTKQINMDGTATLNMYELKEIPVANPVSAMETESFITREEFEQVINQLRMDLQPIQQAPQKITF